MTVKEILIKYLIEHEYDGLFSDGDCSCRNDDLIPCGGDCEDCKPGYLHLGDDDYDFYIKSERESIDSVKEKY